VIGPTSALRVRPARVEDAGRLGRLAAERAAQDQSPRTSEDEEARLASKIAAAAGADVVLVAEIDERAVGFLEATVLPDGVGRRLPGHDGAEALFISFLAVDSGYRGQGVAHELLAAAEDHARRLRMSTLIADAGIRPGVGFRSAFWQDAMGFEPSALVLSKVLTA
jgi:GNAT superfamily N-acetyltransferase